MFRCLRGTGWPAASRKKTHRSCVTRRAGALARRPASPCDRGRAPLGAPSVAIFGLGSAFPAPPFPAEHVQPAPGSTGHSARRAVSEPPGAAVTSRSRGTPLPAPPSGSSPETPLMSEDGEDIRQMQREVNYFVHLFLGLLVATSDRDCGPATATEGVTTRTM